MFLRLRKRRRIEHYDVKFPPLLREPLQPGERVAVDEIVLRGIKAVQDEITFAPFEIFFDRSRLVVRAPASAAQTEKPQVQAKTFKTFRPVAPSGNRGEFAAMLTRQRLIPCLLSSGSQAYPSDRKAWGG